MFHCFSRFRDKNVSKNWTVPGVRVKKPWFKSEDLHLFIRRKKITYLIFKIFFFLIFFCFVLANLVCLYYHNQIVYRIVLGFFLICPNFPQNFAFIEINRPNLYIVYEIAYYVICLKSKNVKYKFSSGINWICSHVRYLE